MRGQANDAAVVCALHMAYVCVQVPHTRCAIC
jgi:hypothetical protein